jgi:hypothetical protein
MNPYHVFYCHRVRELYAYGKYFAYIPSQSTIHHGIVFFYNDVRSTVRASVIALLGALRRRHHRANCPLDIALILAKSLWASREFNTEHWHPRGRI